MDFRGLKSFEHANRSKIFPGNDPGYSGLRVSEGQSYIRILVCFFLHGWSLARREATNFGLFPLCRFDLLKWGRANLGGVLGSQHPSPNVKNFPRFEPQIWPEIITSRDAESTCFEGSRTSCDVINFRIFWPNFGRKRSHHVMDASFLFGAP